MGLILITWSHVLRSRPEVFFSANYALAWAGWCGAGWLLSSHEFHFFGIPLVFVVHRLPTFKWILFSRLAGKCTVYHTLILWVKWTDDSWLNSMRYIRDGFRWDVYVCLFICYLMKILWRTIWKRCWRETLGNSTLQKGMCFLCVIVVLSMESVIMNQHELSNRIHRYHLYIYIYL